MKNEKNKKYFGFTLIEMVIVLFVISLLILLFIPNLSKQRDEISGKGDKAVVQVVDNQIEMYRVNHGGNLTDEEILQKLFNEKQINEQQYEKYKNRAKE